MQGTPLNRPAAGEVEDMEAEGASDGDDMLPEEALDLSIKNSSQFARIKGPEAREEKGRAGFSFHFAPNPQISITDEEGREGEVTEIAWHSFCNAKGKNGFNSSLHSDDSVAEFGTMSVRALEPLQTVVPELQKTSSGSIEVQLSSSCSHLTVSEIISMIERSIRAKSSGLISCQIENATALLLERLGEDVHVAVEVCPSSGPQGLKGLKIRRISGDYMRYDRICNELIACISM